MTFNTAAFKNPFADFDFTKVAGEFKIPTVDVESFVETGRKNFAAMTTASTAAVESFKAIAQRQGDMFRSAMEDFSKHGSEVLAAATIEEKAAKQIDFAKKSYETVSNQLCGLATYIATPADTASEIGRAHV